MTNDIYIHLARCSKAGFFSTKKTDLMNKEYPFAKYLEDDIKHKVINSIKSHYEDSGSKFLINKKYTTKKGEEAIVDMIVDTNEGKVLLEILNSSIEPDWIQIENLAYTYYILKNCGCKIDTIAYVTINQNAKEYGNFSFFDLRLKACTKKILSLQSKVEKRLKKHRETVRNNSSPINKIDFYCVRPSTCPFMKYCVAVEFPVENSIMDLNGISFYQKLQLKWKGVIDFRTLLPKNITLTEKTKNQISYTELNKPKIEKSKIRDWVNKISARKFIWFLDIEVDTVLSPLEYSNKALAYYPFIYTLYYLDLNNCNTGYFQYLISAELNSKSAKELSKKLIGHHNLHPEAPIIVSKLHRTKESLSNLAIVSPELKYEINKLSEKLYDIRSIFVDQLYYDPKFKGSVYMKEIAQIMSTEISYDKLKIKSGIHAQYEYRKLIAEKSNIEQTRIDLKEYSKMDTFSLLKTFEFLKALVKVQ